jgi:DNA repair photolyase
MIISASRRTDIPAFYAEWFMCRVRDGFFYRVNPFNSRQVTGFSLKAEDVDTLCFWTKNPRPLMKHLKELDERGLNYYFQFTLNPYDTVFEPGVPPLQERIDAMIELAEGIGPERVVWRYDPIILSSHTPVSWHLEQAEQLARQLANATRRLMFSFYDCYGKGQGRLCAALTGTGITLMDMDAAEQQETLLQIAGGFKAVADRYRMEIFSCCEVLDSSVSGIPHGACIDGELIRKLFGIAVPAARDKNQRVGCRCAVSADMGSYNSCQFRCRYCYANYNEAMIEHNCRKHRPDSPSLLNEYADPLEIRTRNFKRR